MSNKVAENGQIYLAANANVQCFTGPGEIIGIFVSDASSSPLLTVQDANANVGGNLTRDAANGNMTASVAATFVPVAATFYRMPAKLINGLNIQVGGKVTCTIFANKG